MENNSYSSLEVVKLLKNIFDGNSKYLLSSNNSLVYLKHPSQYDIYDIYNVYEMFCKQYKDDYGLMSKDGQLDFICKMGWWSNDREKEISTLELSISRLEATKKRIIYESDKKRISEQILELKLKLAFKRDERAGFFSLTAEDIASKDAASYFIENFLFSDIDFKNKIQLDDNELYFNELLSIYSKYLEDSSVDNIKKAALSIPFQNMLSISSGSSMDVFGAPISKLTKNQLDLLSWGGYFQKMIKNSLKEIPDNLYNEPDKFIEWYESVNSVEATKNRSKKRRDKKNKYGADSKFLFGERDDIKKISGEISGDKILQDAEKSGSLGIYDLMEK